VNVINNFSGIVSLVGLIMILIGLLYPFVPYLFKEEMIRSGYSFESFIQDKLLRNVILAGVYVLSGVILFFQGESGRLDIILQFVSILMAGTSIYLLFCEVCSTYGLRGIVPLFQRIRRSLFR
jgi:uncharacterized protein (DUF486 family)